MNTSSYFQKGPQTPTQNTHAIKLFLVSVESSPLIPQNKLK